MSELSKWARGVKQDLRCITMARSFDRTILDAGMFRSGSTWLFNAARLILESDRDVSLVSGWITEIYRRKDKTGNALLAKIHDYNYFLAKSADDILYSYRDIRDVLTSMQRAFDQPPTMQFAKQLIHNDRKWKSVATFVVRYEDMMSKKTETIRRLANHLGIDPVDARRIDDRIERMRHEDPSVGKSKSHNAKNLLHASHITDGRHGSWVNELPEDFVSQVEEELADWFIANGYEVPR